MWYFMASLVTLTGFSSAINFFMIFQTLGEPVVALHLLFAGFNAIGCVAFIEGTKKYKAPSWLKDIEDWEQNQRK